MLQNFIENEIKVVGIEILLRHLLTRKLEM